MSNEPLTSNDYKTACLARIDEDGGWCIKPCGHADDEHTGYPSAKPVERNTFGPEHAVQRRWG